MTENTLGMKITELNLDSNNIGDEGAIALSEYLKQYDSLEMLLVSDNHIENEGMAELLKSLKHHGKSGCLVHLELSNNRTN